VKVFVLTYGSRGEFQPLLALARGFADAGHEVRLGGPPHSGFADLAAELRVPFLPVGTEWTADEIRELQKRTPVGDQAVIMRVVVEELMLKDVDDAYERCLEAGGWSDVIVSHYGQPVGQMAAETLGRPFVSAMLDPPTLRIRHKPPPGWQSGPWWLRLLAAGWLNLKPWKAAKSRLNDAFAGTINAARARVGLPPLGEAGWQGLWSRLLNLVAVSPSVVPPARDWAPRHRLTGYWFLQDEGWEPSPELVRFVNGGAKPIAISLGLVAGALPAADGAQLSDLIVDAVERCGVRAVIDPGGLDLGRGEIPSSILRHTARHSWLFPRAAAVVHHGGAGTTAAALRAGVPGVVIPKAWDQPYWAEKAFQLGVASAPIPRKEVTAARLAEAILTAAADARVKRRAAALGEAIRNEDGVRTAVRLVEECASLRGLEREEPKAIALQRSGAGSQRSDGL
jgi:sterol 3beta-glucosyltransferase